MTTRIPNKEGGGDRSPINKEINEYLESTKRGSEWVEDTLHILRREGLPESEVVGFNSLYEALDGEGVNSITLERVSEETAMRAIRLIENRESCCLLYTTGGTEFFRFISYGFSTPNAERDHIVPARLVSEKPRGTDNHPYEHHQGPNTRDKAYYYKEDIVEADRSLPEEEDITYASGSTISGRTVTVTQTDAGQFTLQFRAMGDTTSSTFAGEVIDSTLFGYDAGGDETSRKYVGGTDLHVSFTE